MVQKGPLNAERLETRMREQMRGEGLYEEVKLRWLLANGRHERTLFGRRK
jgi:hypothetical protein